MGRQDKVQYVLNQTQTRMHCCHWPGCTTQVPPAFWGCKKHWYALPSNLRKQLWEAYIPGQEITCNPSEEYIAVAELLKLWIRNNATTT